jgi:alpha-tubulin suppressor-like RCC1 family protein
MTSTMHRRTAVLSVLFACACTQPVVSDISAGWFQSCAVRSDGVLFCWGGYQWPVGRDPATPSATGLRDVETVDVGRRRTCATTHAGEAYCWDHSMDATAPVRLEVSGVRQVSSGGALTCIVTDAGDVSCFAGIGDTPSPIPLVASATKVSVGHEHACAITDDASLYCWGGNEHGELGDGTNEARTSPVRVPLDGVVDVSAGGGLAPGGYTCAATSDGAAYCWGAGGSFRLGQDDDLDHRAPARVDLPPIVRIETSDREIGGGHTCALSAADALFCWGTNSAGEVGVPVNLGLLSSGVEEVFVGGVVDFAVGGSHTCAQASSGVHCWGDNTSGQLGNGEAGVFGEVNWAPRPILELREE